MSYAVPARLRSAAALAIIALSATFLGGQQGCPPDPTPTCTDADGDGFSVEGGSCGAVDWNDASAAVRPGAAEVCDGIDNDCDGRAIIDHTCQEASGFAEGVTGGAGGASYMVTNLGTSGAGSLRDGLESPEPLWITFDVDGIIDTPAQIDVASNKTLDGRGADVTIKGRGLRLSGVSNVIITNVKFDNGDGDSDALQIIDDTEGVWIDHCSFSDYEDGLVDITRGSTDVTISWSTFADHDKVMLIGHSVDQTTDTKIRVTLHHNLFDGTQQRHPRLRYGRVHAFNNVYRHWGAYGMGASQTGEILSQGNFFLAGDDKDATQTVVGSDPQSGKLRSEGDGAFGGAIVRERLRGEVFDAADFYDTAHVEPATVGLQQRVDEQAGWGDVPGLP